MKRLTGPLVSLLIHGLIVFLLVTMVAFRAPPKERTIAFDYAELTDFQPGKEPEMKSPAPDAGDNFPGALEPDVPTAEPEALPDVGMENEVAPIELSLAGLKVPLTRDLGRHQGTLTALKAAYGNRAMTNGLFGTYFNRIDFTGDTFTRIDPTLNKQWELESPWPGKVRSDCFSVIWTGRIVPHRTGVYTLYLQSDDGARLWIDGRLVLDQYVERARQVNTLEIEMFAGKSYDIKYAYCEVYQHAISQLEWSSAGAGIARELIPVDCLWADGPSTEQMLQWNARRGGSYANRGRMPNPAAIRNQPLSHIVNYAGLNKEELVRLQLSDLVPEYQRLARNGKLPTLLAQEAPEEVPASKERKPADDVQIEIL